MHAPRPSTLAVISVVSGLQGCPTEYGLKTNDPVEALEYSLWEYECPPEMEFQTTLYVDRDILSDCLGVDSLGFVSEWPTWVELQFADKDDCLNGSSDVCALLGPLVRFPISNDICDACLPIDDLQDLAIASTCCLYDTDNLSSLDLLANLSGWCEVEQGVFGLVDSSDYQAVGDDYPAAIEEPCTTAPPSSAYASLTFGPNARLLAVDPQSSWISLDDGDTTTFAPLRGTLVIASNPARLLTGALWADAPTGPSPYGLWSFGVHAPVAMNPASGNFTVGPSSQGLFFGSGWISDEEYVARIGMGSVATGALNPVAGVWALTYTESLMGGAVHVHLEGEVVPWD